MRWSRVVDKVLLGWLALAAAQVVAGLVLPIKFPEQPHSLEWMLATDFLVVAVLGTLAVRSDWDGWKLALALSAIPLSINLVNMIEGSVFLKHSGIPWGKLLLTTSLSYILVVPAWRFIFGQESDAPAHYSPLQQKSSRSIVWRFAASDIAYLVLYFTAGAVIFPFVRAFYAPQTEPPAVTIVALQLLLRGPAFVVISLLLLRMFGLPRLTGALAVGLAFTLLSGVAPLLMPNPYFPDAVRLVHMCEVTSSNFVFGTIVGLLWGERRASMGRSHMTQAA